MSQAASRRVVEPAFDEIEYARNILQAEAGALQRMAAELDSAAFRQSVELLLHCRGRVVVTGMGKAGLIGQKLTATFSSTGTAAHYLHPAEAFHGDLGRLQRDDVILALSLSGETEEVVKLLPTIADLGIPLIAITAKAGSTLGQAATLVLALGDVREACQLGLAPSTSTTMMLGLGDALALVTCRRRGFQAEDFARLHPGGSLGRHLTRVEDCMRPLAQCRLATVGQTLREAVAQHCTGRRSGAIMIVDHDRRLQGIFTDSDLARLIGRGELDLFESRIERVMTARPKSLTMGQYARHAIEVLETYKISELPVVDEHRRPVGMIDVTDMIGWQNEDEETQDEAAADDSAPQKPRLHVVDPGSGEG